MKRGGEREEERKQVISSKDYHFPPIVNALFMWISMNMTF